MKAHVRLWPVAIVTTAVLSMAVATASAGKLRFTGSTFRWVTNSSGMTFGALAVSCPVTLEGSFHSSSFIKREQLLLGYVTRGILPGASCTGGSATVLTETLPWHVTYERFTGTLPAITEIALQVHGAAFNISAMQITCLYQSTEAKPWSVKLERETGIGTIMRVLYQALPKIPRKSGSILCAESSEISGTASMTLLESLTSVILSLIA